MLTIENTKHDNGSISTIWLIDIKPSSLGAIRESYSKSDALFWHNQINNLFMVMIKV